jgi:large subunit ribosomal protein L5e
MGFVKVVKNTAYFSRFQVKFRRRREAKTDYQQRKRLIIQDKNKYQTPKYRFVVRFSNKDVTCQIFSADLTHDVCLCAAYSHELPRYGLKTGLKNYAAAYATGLLLARRVNAKYGLKYEGKKDVTGEDYSVADDADPDGAAPFKALLDVGLARTTTGARVFGALKGAVDGGLDIPHKNKRFPGSSKDDSGEWAYDPEVHRKYIFGGHVQDYMTSLKDSDEDSYKARFKKYIDAGVEGADLEKLYKSVHKAIRADPLKKRGPLERGNTKTRSAAKPKEVEKKAFRKGKQSVQQRKARIKQRLTAKGVQSIGPVDA